MKVFITGGTGFLGNHLVQECLKKNFDITCLVRRTAFKTNKNLCASYKKNGIKLVVGDVTDFPSLLNALTNNYYDLVFHLAGIYKTNTETMRVNVNGTRNILNILVKNRNYPERFIFMSSTAAMGVVKSSKPLNEETPCRPENAYEISKFEAEETVKGFDEIKYSVIRAPRIYGSMDSQNTLTFFTNFAKFGVIPVIEHFPLSLVYVKNLVEGIMLAAKKKKAIRNTYIISDKKVYESKEIVLSIADVLGIKKRIFVNIPKEMLNVISIFTGSYKYGLNNVRYSIEKAKKELNYKPKYEFSDALAGTV